MYSTQGLDAIATITELRSKTAEIVEHARTLDRGVLIQKNNEPQAVLLSYERYVALLDAEVKRRKK